MERELEARELNRAQVECGQQQSKKNILINLANSAADQQQRAALNERAKNAETEACDRHEHFVRLMERDKTD